MSDGRWPKCYQCKISIYLSAEQEEYLRQNQTNFYCVWGHPQHFPKGKTNEDILREDLATKQRELDRALQDSARLAGKVTARARAHPR